MGEVLSMDIEDAPRPAKLVIRAAKINRVDAVLAERCGTHDARFDRDIKVCFGKDRIGVVIVG